MTDVREHPEVVMTVPDGLPAVDRRRLLVHMVAEATHALLEQPGADPEGMTITTHVEEDSLVLTATAPVQTVAPELG